MNQRNVVEEEGINRIFVWLSLSTKNQQNGLTSKYKSLDFYENCETPNSTTNFHVREI